MLNMDEKKKLKIKPMTIDPTVFKALADSMKKIDFQMKALQSPLANMVKQMNESTALMAPIVVASMKAFDSSVFKDLAKVAEGYQTVVTKSLVPAQRIQEMLKELNEVTELTLPTLPSPDLVILNEYPNDLRATLLAQDAYIEALLDELDEKGQEIEELRRMIKDYQDNRTHMDVV